jgi:hypothetical protein
VTHLDLQGSLQSLAMPANSAAFSALAACSGLRYLDISYNSFSAGILQQLFAPGRKLPHLQFLDVSVVRADTDTYPRRAAALHLTAADTHQLVDCCPSLQQLRAHGTLHDTAALSALSALSGLDTLVVSRVQAGWSAMDMLEGAQYLSAR